jgi:hypothetical protein
MLWDVVEDNENTELIEAVSSAVSSPFATPLRLSDSSHVRKKDEGLNGPPNNGFMAAELEHQLSLRAGWTHANKAVHQGWEIHISTTK